MVKELFATLFGASRSSLAQTATVARYVLVTDAHSNAKASHSVKPLAVRSSSTAVSFPAQPTDNKLTVHGPFIIITNIERSRMAKSIFGFAGGKQGRGKKPWCAVINRPDGSRNLRAALWKEVVHILRG